MYICKYIRISNCLFAIQAHGSRITTTKFDILSYNIRIIFWKGSKLGNSTLTKYFGIIERKNENIASLFINLTDKRVCILIYVSLYYYMLKYKFYNSDNLAYTYHVYILYWDIKSRCYNLLK